MKERLSLMILYGLAMLVLVTLLTIQFMGVEMTSIEMSIKFVIILVMLKIGFEAYDLYRAGWVKRNLTRNGYTDDELAAMVILSLLMSAVITFIKESWL